METVKHILTDYLVFLIVGLLCVVLGVIIPKLKLYWLIAGLNGRPRKEIEKYNLRYIEKYFGLFMVALGTLTIINPILWTVLNNEKNIEVTFLIIVLGTVGLMFIFGMVDRRRIQNS